MSHAIDELGRATDVPDRQIARLAGLERSDVRQPPERAGGHARHARDAFVDRESKKRRAHVQREQERGQGRSARIAIGREGHGYAVPAHQVDRRLMDLAQEIERTWKQDRDNAGRRHRLNARQINIFEVIG